MLSSIFLLNSFLLENIQGLMFNLFNVFFLSSGVFVIGVFGVLINRSNILILLMAFEVMYLASHINFACAYVITNDITNLVTLLYLLIIVGAESCVGLSILSVYYAIHKSVSLNAMSIERR